MSQIVNTRMDIVSKKRYPISNLFRLVVTSDGIQIEEKEKLKGRGFYLYKSFESIQFARDKNLLVRISKGAVDDSIYERLINKL